jgi:FkbM family methyltransferase
MYQAHGWWFPDQDTHFAEMIGKHIKKGGGPVYQERVRRRSLAHCLQRGVALDIGANVGLWSQELCAVFQQVIAFEPVADFRACLLKNVTAQNLDLRNCALGSQDTTINMVITQENTGHSHVDVGTVGQGTIPMWRLDSLDLPAIDYIKIDCEGYEKNILLGAERTVRSNRPIMVVEDKKHKDVGHHDTEGALELLQSWGACVLEQVNNDVIVGWR